MKNLFLACLIALTGFMQQSFAQNWVNIPDSVFANVLASLYPNAIMQNGNDYFLNSEDSAVVNEENLSISFVDVYDITGIEYFVNLKHFYCSNTSISALPSLPSTLEYLALQSSFLTSVSLELPNLKEFYCGGNFIINIELNMPNLEFFFCDNNDLSTLPILPSGLKQLSCSHNIIDSLPQLPASLNSLNCSYNHITLLPNLPDGLFHLACDHNFLNALSNLNLNLDFLDCSNNFLSDLPELPFLLKTLRCDSNQLTGLSTLPNLFELSCKDNFLQCLPKLPETLSDLNLNNNNLTCLPNYLPIMNNQLFSLPLCLENDTINNPNNCEQINFISGYVYKDIDQNCSNSNFVISNVQVQIENTTTQEIHLQTTLANGSYFMSAENGDFLIRINEQTLPSGLEVYCPTSNEISASINTSTSTNNDFGLVCSGYDLGTQSVHTTGWVFPGQVHQVHVNAGDLSLGLACAPHVSGDIHVSVSGPVGSISFPNATSVQGNTATYSVTDFQGIISDITFVIQTDTLAQTDDEFCVNVSILNTEQTDSNPQNDIYTFCYSVINSYDPNVKLTSPELVLPGYQDEFTYTIYFQNTGSAPAFNIRIEDVLDQKLDVNTFRAVAASHHFTSSINTSNRKLTVRFPAIMLPDSTSNAEESIGFIQYKVKPIQGLQEGTKIYNTASIFFDYNEPIVTNTTENLFSQTASVQMNELVDLKMFPNPTNKLITFSGAEVNQIKVTDVMGKIMFVSSVTSNQVSVEELKNGVYFIELETSLGIQFKQLVVQKH